MRAIFICAVAVIAIVITPPAHAGTWQQLDQGLEIAYFKLARYSPAGDSTVTVVRVDPKYWDFRLLSASEQGGENRSAAQWSRAHNLALTFNAGMFQTDYRTNVGYMKNYQHLNNGHVNAYNSVAAFNPKEADTPPFKIFDTDETGFEEVSGKYHTVIQNLRLIKRPGENRWSPQPKIWSELALGQDKSGRALVIFCRSPYAMKDLNDELLKLPLELVCAQHLEGGPEAQLYLDCGDFHLELCGSYETQFFQNNGNITGWPIPNVIGVGKRNPKEKGRVSPYALPPGDTP